MTGVTGVSAVVIKTSDIDKLREFYTGIGLTFVEEKHGTGPKHFSTTINGLGRFGVCDFVCASDCDRSDTGI